jgi:hypothetical protein
MIGSAMNLGTGIRFVTEGGKWGMAKDPENNVE